MIDPSDPRLAPYRLVGDAPALARDGLFVAEGRLVVERLLDDHRFRVHSVLVTPAAAAAMGGVFERRRDAIIHVCPTETLREITGFNFHRGCLALAHRPCSAPAVADLAAAQRVLALEGVSNPDNVGGLFRTALAFGVDAVVLDEASADPLYRKAIRTSMAATLRLPYLRAAAWLETLAALRAGGMRIVALTPQSGTVALDEAGDEASDRCVIAVGSEGFGLAPATLALADRRVRIPIDVRADSLNVVTAAGIALYALRKKGTAPFLPESGGQP